MDCLQIDWDAIDRTFVRDEFYENIQAPKWIDFTAPLQPVDDFEWFCAKSGCTDHNKKIEAIQEDMLAVPKPAPTAAKKPTNVIEFGGKKGRAMVSSCSVSSVSEIKESFAKNRTTSHQSKMAAELNKNAEKKSRTYEKLLDHSKRLQQQQLQQQHSAENENPNKVQGGLSKMPMISKAPEVMHNKKMKMFEDKSNHASREASGVPQKSWNPPGESLSIALKARNLLGDASCVVASQQTRNPRAGESAGILHGAQNALGEISGVTQKGRNLLRESSRVPPRGRNLFGESFRASRRVLDVASKYSSSITATTTATTATMTATATVSSSSSLITIGCKSQGAGGRRNVLASSMALSKRSKDAESATTTARSMRSLLHLGDVNKASSGVLRKAPSCRDAANRKEDDKSAGARVGLPRHEKTNLPQAVRKSSNSRTIGHSSAVLSSKNREGDSQMDVSPSPLLLKAEVVVDAQEEEEEQEGKEALEMSSLQMSLMSLNLPGMEDDGSVETNKKGESCSGENRDDMVDQITVSDETSSAKGHEERCVEEMDNVSKLRTPKKWRKTQGTKRKSAELSFKVNCSSKEHKVLSKTRPLFSSTCYHQSHLLMKRSPIKGMMNHSMIISNDSCKEQHKKLKSSTTQPIFKPFRFRTEERIALKENGFGKKEEPSNQDVSYHHHALRMPSFSQPFRPQRSNKKLTVPKEPKFHLSRARKACTKQVALPPPTAT